MDITEAMICQHLYCPGNRNVVWKEITNCDTCQFTKKTKIKYSKLPAKEAEEIPWNKLCVNIIGPCVIIIKLHKEKLNLKAVTMIDPVTGWFKIMQYDDKRAISITNLVENTWLPRYPRPMEITCVQGSEFIGHEFRKYLIEKIWDNYQAKHFRKSYLQFDIGMDSPRSRKPSADF